MSSPLEEAAGELTRTVAALNSSIAQGLDLRDELAELVERSRVNRKLIVIVAAGFVLDIILTLVMGLVIAQVSRNADRIDAVVQVQHDSALCPLYKIFIEGDTPANRKRAAEQGQDMAARARAFVTIRDSYAKLNCRNK